MPHAFRGSERDAQEQQQQHVMAHDGGHSDAGGVDDDASWRQFERDYYALLGVARDASSDEIRSRYMALSREFHPDRRRKQQDAALIALANTQYPVLDRAYKVLCDPVKRHVYNLYGERGVHALEQDAAVHNVVGAHLKSPEEMQHHVEDVIRRMNAHALEGQFSSFSEMSMHVDASDFVRAPMRGLRSLMHRGGRYVARSETTIHQRTMLPLTRHLDLTLGGYMYDKHGLGMGSFTAQLAYASPDPSVPSCTVSTELGWTPKLHCQISQPVSPHTVFMVIPELDDNGLDVSFGANQLLSPQLHGAMMWSTRDGLSASLSHDAGAGHTAAAAVAIGPGGPSGSLQLRRALTAVTTAKLAVRANLFAGVSVAAGASRELSRRTRLALGVLVARAGVTLRIGLTRGSVRFVVPIFVAPFAPQSAFATFVAATSPFVVSALVTQLLAPAAEKRRRRERERRRDARVQYIAAARDTALAQQQLMQRCAAEKREREAARADKRGLVVLVARYGKNPTSPDPRSSRDGVGAGNSSGLAALAAMATADSDDDSDGSAGAAGGDVTTTTTTDDAALEQKWIDVTVPLQFFVQDSALALHGRSKAGLLGFYNPCIAHDQCVADAALSIAPADQPKLYVRYAYDGCVFEATFDDEQVVALPSRHAQVMGPVGSVY